MCHAFVLVYLLCYGYVLLHVMLLGCRFFECLCCLFMDYVLDPVEVAMCLNFVIVSLSRHVHDTEHIPSLML